MCSSWEEAHCIGLIKEASLTLARTGEVIQITVSDAGVGFDGDNGETERGFGLFSIRQRVTHHRGQMRVRSKLGDGAQVMILIPVGSSR